MPGHLDITSLNMDLTHSYRRLCRLNNIGFQCRVKPENRFHDVRLTLPHFISHAANQHFLSNGHGRIAGEKEIVQGPKLEPFLTQKPRQVVFAHR